MDYKEIQHHAVSQLEACDEIIAATSLFATSGVGVFQGSGINYFFATGPGYTVCKMATDMELTIK